MILRAVMFDLDATLVDSEGQTDAVIERVMARHGFPGIVLPPNETRGRTWDDIAAALLPHAVARPPIDLEAGALKRELINAWGASIDSMIAIPGAPDAVRAVKARGMKIAVVSSSPRDLVERILKEKLGVRDAVDVVVGAEDVERPKPAPECWLKGARMLDVPPKECAVFEDSRAGLIAARDAGIAQRILVLHRCGEPDVCKPLATRSIEHYASTPLDDKFWSTVRA